MALVVPAHFITEWSRCWGSNRRLQVLVLAYLSNEQEDLDSGVGVGCRSWCRLLRSRLLGILLLPLLHLMLQVE